MKRRTLKRRNPMAVVVRKLRPKRIPSAKAYRRQEKHKDRLHIEKWDGPFSFGELGKVMRTIACTLSTDPRQWP